MVSTVTVILLSVMSLSEATHCPVFACSSALGANDCGSRVNNTSFLVNSNACGTGFQCGLMSFWTWVETYTTAYYTCTPVVSSSSAASTTTWTSAACGTHQLNKSFKSGNTLVLCNADTDCTLLDNSHTTCDCAVRSDGAGVCRPDPSNDMIFGGYWADCGSNSLITVQSAYLYWSWYLLYWVDTQSDLACNYNFAEIKELDTLSNAYTTGAAALAAGILGALVIAY